MSYWNTLIWSPFHAILRKLYQLQEQTPPKRNLVMNKQRLKRVILKAIRSGPILMQLYYLNQRNDNNNH
jgi:hypothetical protein